MRTTGGGNVDDTRWTSRRSPAAAPVIDSPRGGARLIPGKWPRTSVALMICAQPSAHVRTIYAALNNQKRNAPMVRRALELSPKITAPDRHDVTSEKLHRALHGIGEAPTGGTRLEPLRIANEVWGIRTAIVAMEQSDVTDESIAVAHAANFHIRMRRPAVIIVDEPITQRLQCTRPLKRGFLSRGEQNHPTGARGINSDLGLRRIDHGNGYRCDVKRLSTATGASRTLHPFEGRKV